VAGHGPAPQSYTSEVMVLVTSYSTVIHLGNIC